MIYDKIDNAQLYHFSPAILKALDFLRTVSPATPDGIHELQGKDIYANVQSYRTEANPSDLLEGHMDYIDIQTIITGEEFISFTHLEGLENTIPYDTEKDVAFFRSPEHTAKLHMTPGLFVLLYPQDAHMGKFTVNFDQDIKKVVIKIRTNLL